MSLTKNELVSLVYAAFRKNVVNFKTNKGLINVIMVFNDHTRRIGMFTFGGSKESKAIAVNAMRQYVAVKGAEAVLVVSEAWTAPFAGDERDSLPPSKRDDRVEIIFVNGVCPGHSFGVQAPIIRKNSEVQIGEPIPMDRTESWMTDGLWLTPNSVLSYH